MKYITSALFTFLLIVGAALAQPGDPPLEQYIHSQNGDGTSDIVVLYHENHTLEISRVWGAGNSSYGQTLPQMSRWGDGGWTGRWWLTADKFCFALDPPAANTAEKCKPKGHLIGKAMAPGFGTPESR